MKKVKLLSFILLFFFLLSFNSLVFSDSITSLKIDKRVELNKNLAIYGKYSDGGGKLCSFYIFDPNDENQLLERLSDEYTLANGSFSSTPYKITEPTFKRGYDYNVFVCCNTGCDSNTFYVEQKEDIFFGITSSALLNDLRFWSSGENSIVVVFYMIFITISALFLSVFIIPLLKAYNII